MKTKNTKKAGFTMVEIIAVLVIIGIMAAVAAPKFINMAGKARVKASQSGINEAKAALSVAYAKAYLDNDGTAPTVAEVVTAADFDSGALPESDIDFGDIRVDVTASGADILITVDEYNGTAWDAAWGTAPSDTWVLPTP
jgi:prepilin-type N-terminal cleavage/methylation domain-containing protein